jgi:hypothetical protein
MIAVIDERQTAYQVEVSGWDRNEDFFVEKTELRWREESGKQISLQRPIVSGSLLYLRLIHPAGGERVRPMPFRAELFAEGDEDGHRLVRLLPAIPGR